MPNQITLNGKTFKYTSSSVYRNGKLVYEGPVTLSVLKVIAKAIA